MTSLHERTGFSSDLLDSAAEDVQAALILRDNEFDLRAKGAQAALLDTARMPEQVAAPTTGPRTRLFALVRTVANGFRAAFARSPKHPRPQRMHYPPRFGIEFETSLVDRERRRL